MKELLAKGANLEAKTRHGLTPLYYAASHGNIDVLSFLIEKGADINVRDTFYKASALSFTVQNGHMAAALILVQKGTKDAESVLPPAAGKGEVELVKAILARGDIKPATLTRALNQAEEAKQAQVVEMLKQAGVQPAEMPDFAVDAAVLASTMTSNRPRMRVSTPGRSFAWTAAPARWFGRSSRTRACRRPSVTRRRVTRRRRR